MLENGREFDVVVVGAGAAGIAAARRLLAARLNIMVVEARDRIGGRAYTVQPLPGVALDLGCEWLHSADRNPWTGIARQLGFAIDEKLPDWGSRVAWLKGKDADADWQRTREAFYARLDSAAEEPGDRAASELLEPGNRWNPLLRAISTWANGAELDQVSVKDYFRYDPSNVNWRVLQGYGNLITRYGEGLPLSLGTAVTRIDHGGHLIRVETDRGDLLARAVIVTLPTNVLASGSVGFIPALPEKLAAAAGLPMHVVNKFYLRLDGAIDRIEPDSNLVGNTDSNRTGAYHIRPHGWPVILGYYGGDCAASLEEQGLEATADFAVGELAGLFGNDIRKRLFPLTGSAWGAEKFSRGAYSMALPGHADDRALLAAPVDGRLFFAGEACSAADFGTAHAAYLTGEGAAKRAIAALNASRAPAASHAGLGLPDDV
ncbi:MAG: NAD(P)/FAD-dependent oxidoreductase [Stellaceae bacterium]